jgi:hypothetical protein
MAATTFEAVIENGQVRLPARVVLPEHQTVYVVVPNVIDASVHQWPNIRLANPEDAKQFEMKVIWGESA